MAKKFPVNHDVFCIAPWQASYYKESQKKYKMCCVFDTWTSAESPEDYFNSDIVKSVRESIANGKWHSGCKVCQEQQEAGLESDRKTFNRSILGKQQDAHEWYKEHTDEFNLKWLDYRPGNLCNLKCRMCSPSNSSLIAKETIANPDLKRWTDDSLDVTESDLLPAIANDTTFRNLSFLKLLGGEPTIDPQIQKLLDWVTSNDYAKNLHLRYTTNATNVNPNWVKAVKQFKDCKIQLSLDGAGPTYNYVRTGANWEKIRENILKMPDLIPNIAGMGVNIVWSWYLCFTVQDWLPELKNLQDELKWKHNVQLDFNVIDATAPKRITVRNLTEEFKTVVAEQLKELKNKDILPDICNSLLYYTQRKPFNNNETVLQNLKHEFFTYNDRLDEIRKTNIHDLSPIYETLRQKQL